jgi:hypothetical protein
MLGLFYLATLFGRFFRLFRLIVLVCDYPRGETRPFNSFYQQFITSFRRIVSNEKFIILQKHFNSAHSGKLFQSLFDLLRSGHSYRAAFSFHKTVYVQTGSFQIL